MTEQPAPDPAPAPREADGANTIVRARPMTFFGAPLCADLDTLEAHVGFLGVPFDLATTGRPGTRFGPDGVREVSMRYGGRRPPGEWPGWYDYELGHRILEGVTLADCGDVDIRPQDFGPNNDRMTAAVRQILDRGAFPVVVGGDHAITFPIIRGFDRYPDLSIVHFDTHQDYTDEYRGVRLGHGNPLRRASELPFVREITQIGIRGLTPMTHAYEESQAHGVRVITARRFLELGPEATAAEIAPADAYYVTIDIDVLDPALAPGTGTPEPGGFGYYALKDALRAVAQRGRIVGFDLVEVSPPYDHQQITARIAARLILDFLGAIFGTSRESRVDSQQAPVAAGRSCR